MKTRFKRAVVKIGSNVLAGADSGLDTAVMEGLVGRIAGIFAAGLQVLFVPEMFGHIIVQKPHGLLDIGSALAPGASIHQVVHRGKQLAVFGVDQAVAGDQFRCYFIMHGTILLSDKAGRMLCSGKFNQ